MAAPTALRRVEVYWFDDTGRGECRLPASWLLLYREEGSWREVPAPSAYPVGVDRYDAVDFGPVTTTGLRLEVVLQEGWAAGIHEWRVE
ncbi:MAG: hypothetical protein H8E31_03100 [Planctomycetes bacterium]|nr:hypothetical protein [Planctomycetota bacterium]